MSCRSPKKTRDKQNRAKVKIRPKQVDTFLLQAKFLSQDKILDHSRMSTDIFIGPLAAGGGKRVDVRVLTGA